MGHPCDDCRFFHADYPRIRCINEKKMRFGIGKDRWRPDPEDSCSFMELKSETEKQGSTSARPLHTDGRADLSGSVLQPSVGSGMDNPGKGRNGDKEPRSGDGHRKRGDSAPNGNKTTSGQKRTKRIHEDGSVLSEQGAVP